MKRAHHHRRTDLRRAYLLEHPLAFTIALTSVLSAAILLAIPQIEDASSLAIVLPVWAEYAWIAVYGAGGVLMASGMWRLSPRLEAAGCWLLAGALAVDIVAIFSQRGIGGGLVSSVLGGVALGMLIRAALIVRRYG